MDEASSDSDSTDAPPSLNAPKPTDLGKRVLFYSMQDKKQKYGVLRYVGSPEFHEGTFCGIELDRPVGKNNGSIHGIRYFVCEPNHGVFVPLAKVELDTSRRSRSRPNSAPSSRNSSVERKREKSATTTPNNTNASPKMTYILQKDLVNRLSAPSIQKRKTGTAVTSYRQPLKAFATKEVKREEENKKKGGLAPFRSGGLVKAQSTENLRGMKDKDKSQGQLKTGMPSKKSSSFQNLRSSTTGSSSKTSTKSTSPNKPLKKKGRVNSCSDLLDSSDTSSSSSNKSTSSDFNSSRRSADVSSMFSDSSSSRLWPRTSTPGNRDDQTPDGCSSPDDMSDSQSSTSICSGGLQHSQGTEDSSLKMVEKAFILTPESSRSTTPIKSSSSTGLATQTKEFVENERKSPSLEPYRVPSPEGMHSKQRYKNRPSGSATLSHPLTSTLTNGTCGENPMSNRTQFLSPQEFVKSLVGPDGTVSLCLCVFPCLCVCVCCVKTE